MTERAWTLGPPSAYELAVRIPSNAKAPGGIVFRKPAHAIEWAQDPERTKERYPEGSHPWDWTPYEIELPTNWDSDTSMSRSKVWRAFHDWHPATTIDTRCGICMGDDSRGTLSNAALLVEARFINPDTGTLA